MIQISVVNAIPCDECDDYCETACGGQGACYGPCMIGCGLYCK